MYGSLAETAPPFLESTPYSPNSPYSASKAASDHLVNAWNVTYGLPTLISNCSNNFGPRQHAEKLIPMVINNAIENNPIPIYGDGKNIRDWLYVTDHCDAIIAILESGRSGESYNVGGNNEKTNLELVSTLLDLIGKINGEHHINYKNLIEFVPDRKGHDRRYAVDSSKITLELGWSPRETFRKRAGKNHKMVS